MDISSNTVNYFNRITADFPILKRNVNSGSKLVYLDSAATSQKPVQVIEAMNRFYQLTNANIHRGIHQLSEESTAEYENARKKIAIFIGARSKREIIYTRNTTESINLVAQTWGRKNLDENDVVILTEMEHHSNIVPWQILAQEKGLKLKFIQVDESGRLNQEHYEELLKLSPKLVSIVHMSNVLGTINSVKEMISKAHTAGALTLIDGAQSVPHMPIDVIDLDADFLAFSAHKMCGPTGLGILYGKEKLLDEMPPYMGGGDMIKRVSLETFSTNNLPHKFEAGTPAIAEAIGFGAAIDYLTSIGMEKIAIHEKSLGNYLLESLSEIPQLDLLGKEFDHRGAVASFSLTNIHPHDVASLLDHQGIAVRAGHHCAMPLHKKFNLPATTRASLYLYNTKEDIDLLLGGLKDVIKLFG